mgnify:CR=1 FL=1
MLYNLFENRDFVSVFAVALLAEGVDRNIAYGGQIDKAKVSPSSQRAWIEIQKFYEIRHSASVSPSSQRAWIEIQQRKGRNRMGHVALLAEGVDRNNVPMIAFATVIVALLAEGVDRNFVRR